MLTSSDIHGKESYEEHFKNWKEIVQDGHRTLLKKFSDEIRTRFRIFHQYSPRSIKYFFWAFFLEPCIISKYRNDWPEPSRNWDIWEYARYLRDPTHPIQPPHRKLLQELLKTRTQAVEPLENEPEIRLVQRHNHAECDRVIINVGGRLYETQIRTLNRFDGTLLGHPQRRVIYYDKVAGWYFFDRNREAFENILYFYQSGGRLLRPPLMHAEKFYGEAEFFDLGDNVLKRYRIEEGLYDELEILKLPKTLLSRKIFLFFEVPTSSLHAHMLSIISVGIVIAAVVVFCLGTEEMFGESRNPATIVADIHPIFSKDPLDLLELTCVFWFAFELLIRFIVTPNKTMFFTMTTNLLDFIAIVPYCIKFAFAAFEVYRSDVPTSTLTFTIVSLIRLCHVFRVLKLSRYMRSLQILGMTLQSSFKEILLLISFLCIAVLIFSFAVYVAEGGPDTVFPSIPSGFYWAVTTMTTVGYGDVVPREFFGKLVGALCAVTGVLVLAFPVPIMVSNFGYYYNRKSNRERSLSIANTTKSHVLMCPYLPRDGNLPDDSTGVKRNSRKDPSIHVIPDLPPPKSQSQILYERRMRRFQLLAL